MSPRVGNATSELGLVDGARIQPAPNGRSEYVCPQCERPIPTIQQVRLAKPARYETELNDVFKCSLPILNGSPGQRGAGTKCGFIFSPKQNAIVVSR